MNSLYDRQRVRARKDASDSGSVTDSASDASTLDTINTSSKNNQSASDSESSNAEDDNSEEHQSNASDPPPGKDISSTLIEAPEEAQATLGKRKRSSENDDDNLHGSDYLSKYTAQSINAEALERKAGKKDHRNFTRTSKHAPAEFSSKKAVSRKREVVPSKKIEHRDPRFESLSGTLDSQKLKKNYSFLDTYRDSEMHDLQSAIRKTKNPEAKEQLKRALLSIQSRMKAEQIKEEEQEVLRKHRKEEKVKIEQGKKPFYLKKADQKQLALKKRFEGMKGKQVDKVIERRRKKQASKEKKTMPAIRRG